VREKEEGGKILKAEGRMGQPKKKT